MKKQTQTKIISGLIFFGFVMFFLSPFSLNKASAIGDLNWDNPNKNGDNPYRLTSDVIFNSQTLMQVVGCTGVVDAVSGALVGFAKDTTLSALKTLERLAKERAKAKACEIAKAGIESAGATATGMSLVAYTADIIKCNTEIKTSSTEQVEANKDQQKIDAATKKREECFNGIAYTLAKNQLTSMTRQAINWVNTGFSGNPFYVQNMRSLTNSIERNVIETGINVLTNKAFPGKAYPYGADFSNTIIRSYNGGALNGAANFLESMTSDLAAFLTDDDSYFNSTDTRTATERARANNQRYSADFSTGGWNGFLALTQRDNNNPLGFAMRTSQYLADRIAQQSNETKSEVYQNNGFLSQKECIKWWWWEDANTPTKGAKINNNNDVLGKPASYEPVYKTYKHTNFDKCTDWKTTTPGSIIKEKLTTYINSPERQLELSDTINESLNSLFTQLIENFRSEGLFGLSQERYSAVDDMIGYGVNGTGVDGAIGSGYSTGNYSSGYKADGSFDLTRDLGNTYIHGEVRSLGKWDAKNNVATYNGDSVELNVDLGIYNNIESKYEDPNYYFTVTTPGNTKLFNNGYNGWAEGDRAFWDGTKWQNWKCIRSTKTGECTYQSPVANRGIIQTQKDYVVAAKEILKMLPGVMPKIGELDYCIPGPNPSLETSTTGTKEAFLDFVGSLNTLFDAGGFFVRNSTTVSIAGKGNDKYDNYAKIFEGNTTLFNDTTTGVKGLIQSTQPWLELQSFPAKYKDNKSEDEIKNQINKTLETISKNVTKFYTNYTKQIFETYYGTMRSEYNEIESSPDLVLNTDYVPMIEDGYAITKSMASKAEQIQEETKDYNDSIILANLNTAKLNAIKSEVSKIIKDAQTRRDNNTEFQKKVMDFFGKDTWTTAKVAYEKYKADYPNCFTEENISYFDDGDIIVDTFGEEGRCGDSLDNDLDGLVDMLDPDCKNAPPGETGSSTPTLTVINPGVIFPGGTATIKWSSSYTKSCVETRDPDTNIGTSGVLTVRPSSSTSYTISCKGDDGKDITRSVRVIVKSTTKGVNYDSDAVLSEDKLQ